MYHSLHRNSLCEIAIIFVIPCILSCPTLWSFELLSSATLDQKCVHSRNISPSDGIQCTQDTELPTQKQLCFPFSGLNSSTKFQSKPEDSLGKV